MASTHYVDLQGPPVNADWLNDVNQLVYQILGTNGAASSTAAQVVTALGISATLGSIAALRTRTPATNNEIVMTSGYYLPGDHGAGMYFYDQSDTTSTDNGGTVIVGTAGSRWKLLYDGKITVRQFGAKGDGIADDTAAIQAALNVGVATFIANGNYNVSYTINFTAHGQQLVGESSTTFGDKPLCTLTWIGGAGGRMVSFIGGAIGYNNCALSTIRLNGNNLANIGVDVSQGIATYRNLISRVFIEFVNNGTNATGIALGLAAFPNFSNDTIIEKCYIGGCSYGITGAGSTYQIENTTIYSVAGQIGIKAYPGAYFTLSACVLTGGLYNIEATSPQSISVSGSWLENSTLAVYHAITSHKLSMIGTYMATQGGALMDLGNAAGTFSVLGCAVSDVSVSNLITNVNGGYAYSVIGSDVTVAPGYTERIFGYIRADQGAFAAGLTNDVANVTGNGTAYSLNNTAWSEDFDLASLFDATTGIFTAPLYGYYRFKLQLSLSGLASTHTDCQLMIVANGQPYLLARINPGVVRTASNELLLAGEVRVALTPAQTVFAKVVVSGTGLSVGIASGNAMTNWRTRFEGQMV